MDHEHILDVAQNEFYNGHYREAENLYQQVLNAEPGNFTACHKLGLIALKTGRLEAGIDLINQALVKNPSSPEAYYDQGVGLQELGKLEQAKDRYKNAINLKPDYAEAHNNIGVLLRDSGDLLEAIEHYQKAIHLEPKFGAAHSNLGLAFQELGDFESALKSFGTATNIDNTIAEVHYNLGVTYQALQQLQDAVKSYKDAIAIRPNLAEAHANLGLTYRDLAMFKEARTHYQNALKINPNLAETHYNLGMLQLSLGNFHDGWQHYQWRWHSKPRNCHPHAMKKPMWDGNKYSGKVIYIYAEQGLGDTIQFVRYLPLLKSMGYKTLLQIPQPLMKLFQNCGIADDFILPGEVPPHFDYHASLLDIPSILDTTLGTIPDQTPYLHCDSRLNSEWAERISSNHTLKVGIAWAGNPKQTNDRYRSVEPKLFQRITEIPEVSAYSLQLQKEGEALATFSESITDLAPNLKDFSDTASAINHLDLVISVDTSVAHLAGSLSCPVWVPLHSIAHWIYPQDREDCPWYPTMRLFRQETYGDWDQVFAKMHTALLDQIDLN